MTPDRALLERIAAAGGPVEVTANGPAYVRWPGTRDPFTWTWLPDLVPPAVPAVIVHALTLDALGRGAVIRSAITPSKTRYWLYEGSDQGNVLGMGSDADAAISLARAWLAAFGNPEAPSAAS